MVQLGGRLRDYHVEESGETPADVRYKANDIFQWFYEIDAGQAATRSSRGSSTVTTS